MSQGNSPSAFLPASSRHSILLVSRHSFTYLHRKSNINETACDLFYSTGNVYNIFICAAISVLYWWVENLLKWKVIRKSSELHLIVFNCFNFTWNLKKIVVIWMIPFSHRQLELLIFSSFSHEQPRSVAGLAASVSFSIPGFWNSLRAESRA